MVLLKRMAYPSRFFSWFLGDLILGITFFVFYSLLFKSNQEINGYKFADFYTYFVISMIISKITSSTNIANQMSASIKDGSFSFKMIKPMNSAGYISAEYLGARISELFVPVAFFVTCIFLFPQYFVISNQFPQFFLSFVLGSIIGFYFFLSVGAISFYVIDSWGYRSIIQRIVQITNGTLMPLDLLPKAVGTVSMFLPFRYMHYLPISIYLGRVTGIQMYKEMFIQVIFIFIVFLVYKIVWTRGYKQYGAVGQ